MAVLRRHPTLKALKNSKSLQSERKRELAFYVVFLKGHWLRGWAVDVYLLDRSVINCVPIL